MFALQRGLFREEWSGSSILAELEHFQFNGHPTTRADKNGIPFLFNEYWTARQRQANSLHEVSYRACFKPQLPAFFITRLTKEGDVVYDPFMGRGTTPIESSLLGRKPIGNDINPLSVYLTRPRINPPSMSEISVRLSQMTWAYTGPLHDDLLAFYHEDTLRAIHYLREYFSKRESAGEIDAVDDWIRMVALNRLTGHSSGFFSVYSLPPNQAVSVSAQRKINEKRGQIPPYRDVASIIAKKSRSLLKDYVPHAQIDANLIVGLASDTPTIPTSSVDLVVTSPPFLDIVQYAADNWLRCWFASIDTADVAISMHKKPGDWTKFVRSTFEELARVVRPGGYIAFEVGEVRNGTVELELLVLEALEGLPLEPICVVVNVQEFTKTANCWGVGNNAAGTNTNRIVLVKRS